MEQNQTGGPDIPVPAAAESHQNNTVMAVLAYLGILIIIPFLTNAKNDPFVKFHMKQGLALLIAWVAVFVLSMMPVLGLFAWILDIALFVLMIVGIINAVSGKQVHLPVIGGFAEKLNF